MSCCLSPESYLHAVLQEELAYEVLRESLPELLYHDRDAVLLASQAYAMAMQHPNGILSPSAAPPFSPTSYASSAPSPSELGVIAPNAEGAFDLSEAEPEFSSSNNGRPPEDVSEGAAMPGFLAIPSSHSDPEMATNSREPFSQDQDNRNAVVVGADQLVRIGGESLSAGNEQCARPNEGRPSSDEAKGSLVGNSEWPLSAAQKEQILTVGGTSSPMEQKSEHECPEIIDLQDVPRDESCESEAQQVEEEVEVQEALDTEKEKEYLDEAFEIEDETEFAAVPDDIEACDALSGHPSLLASSCAQQLSDPIDVFSQPSSQGETDAEINMPIRNNHRITKNATDTEDEPTDAAAVHRHFARQELGARSIAPHKWQKSSGKAKKRCLSASVAQHAGEDSVDPQTAKNDVEAATGFLLPFLVASSVDAPRAVRVAARLRSAKVHNATDLLKMKPSSLREAGLRVAEIKQLLQSAQIAVESTQAKLQKPHQRTVRQSKSAPKGTRRVEDGLKPRKDPTLWAQERRARVLSAKRRRQLRLTE